MRVPAIIGLFLLAFPGHMAGPGLAAERIGGAFRIINQVDGDGSSGKRRLVQADPVFRDEAITAAVASRGEIELADGARILVGENSTIRLDDFVVGADGFSSGTVNIAKGAFRFISGKSRRGAISVRTPLSTIGIRGTAFDVYVDGNGVTRVVLVSGRINACATGGPCLQLTRACDIVQISGPNQVSRLPFLRSAARSRVDEAAAFNLMENQNRHSAGWRLFDLPCNGRAAQEAMQNAARPNASGHGPAAAAPPANETPSQEPSEGEYEGGYEGGYGDYDGENGGG